MDDMIGSGYIDIPGLAKAGLVDLFGDYLTTQPADTLAIETWILLNELYQLQL